MTWFSREPYVSDITKMLAQLHVDRPELAGEQQAGHDLLRNKRPVTRQEQVSDQAARVAQQPYVYHSK